MIQSSERFTGNVEMKMRALAREKFNAFHHDIAVFKKKAIETIIEARPRGSLETFLAFVAPGPGPVLPAARWRFVD